MFVFLTNQYLVSSDITYSRFFAGGDGIGEDDEDEIEDEFEEEEDIEEAHDKNSVSRSNFISLCS